MQIACDYSDGASADVNRHPLAPNHLHHAINGEFSRSTFSRYDSADENDVPSPSQAGKLTIIRSVAQFLRYFRISSVTSQERT